MFIYKIWKEDCDDFYIGSTEDFHKRKLVHKSSCNNTNCIGYNYKIYSHIRANGGWDSWNMDIIEECETRDREIELIKEMKPSLNSMYYSPTFNRKEWCKKYNKNYRKEYYKINADRIKEKIKCECGGIWTLQHKARHMKSVKHQKYLGNSQF
tara:strand:+ start:142 stop:600 length:459 start_codon:yes stop_codon:yes gene_type:complete